MTLEFIDNYLEKKLSENEDYIVCTYYDLRVKNNLSEQDIDNFLQLSRNKLQNNGYKVFFTGTKYDYKNEKRIVQDNEIMVAVKE